MIDSDEEKAALILNRYSSVMNPRSEYMKVQHVLSKIPASDVLKAFSQLSLPKLYMEKKSFIYLWKIMTEYEVINLGRESLCSLNTLALLGRPEYVKPLKFYIMDCLF